MRRKTDEKPESRSRGERTSATEGAPHGPEPRWTLALLKVDPDKGVSEEEFRLFLRELGLPEAKD